MGLSATEMYRLKVGRLQEGCARQGLDCSGTFHELRRRLVGHLKAAAMDSKTDPENSQTSGSGVPSSGGLSRENFEVDEEESHVRGTGECNPVLVELMRKVSPLNSEEPEAILRFIARVDEIYRLKLCSDRAFVMRILPLVPGVILRFFGECLVNDLDWDQCKKDLLREFFPHFIRERLIRDLITFNFHSEGTPVREYIDLVFSAARILEHESQEQSLVDRIVMNLHPKVLAHSAFMERPHTRKELYGIVGIIEEKMAVAKERQRYPSSLTEQRQEESRERVGARGNESGASNAIRCWECGRRGHIQRFCRRRSTRSGNGQVPGGSRTPGPT